MSTGLAHVFSLIASAPGVLCLLPALALIVPLLLRRYPGERLLAELSQRRRSGWRRAISSAPPPRRRVWAIPARGGRLLGRSLAVRPPPFVPSMTS